MAKCTAGKTKDGNGKARPDAASTHAAMLEDLIGQAHQLAKAYFEDVSSAGVDAPGTARLVGIGIRLAALSAQLITASDRHRTASRDG